jgi:sugar lactone lactonase YvrE
MFDCRRALKSATVSFALVSVVLVPGHSQAQAVKPFIQSFQNSIALAARNGGLYVANSLSDSVSLVLANGIAVKPFSTKVQSPQGVAFDATGNLYVANGATGTITKITPAMVTTVFATGFKRPQALAFDKPGNLYVADQMTGLVSRVTPAGVTTAFAHGFTMPSALAFDGSGSLYVADAFTGIVSKVITGGVVTSFDASLFEPVGLAVDAKGNLYVSELQAGQITKITPAGTATVVVPATALGGSIPQGLAIAGNKLYIAGLDNTIHAVTITAAGVGAVSRYAPPLYQPTGLAQDAKGNLFVINAGNNTILEIPAGGIQTKLFASGFTKAAAIATDTTGNVYVADSTAGTVTKITLAGTKTVIVTNVPAAQSLALDGGGNLYVGGSTGGLTPQAEITKVTPVGASVLAVLNAAPISCLAVNKYGVLYAFLAPGNNPASISSISSTGAASTFAVIPNDSGLYPDTCNAMALDASGSIYVSGSYYPAGYYAGIFSVSSAAKITPIQSAVNYHPVAGLLVDSISGQIRLSTTDSTTDSINYILPALKPTVAAYSTTKADYEGLYLEITLAGYDGDFLGCRTGLNSNLKQLYSACLAADGFGDALTNFVAFRTDLGLTSAGTVPLSGASPIGGPIAYGLGAVWIPYFYPRPGASHPSLIFDGIPTDNAPPPPESANASGLTAAGQTIAFDLTVGSTGNPLQATTLGIPVGGTVATLTPTSVTYTPTKAFTGIGSFTFVVQNYQGTSTPAEAFVAVGVPSPARPTLSTLSTTSGSTAGGQSVTISGTNLAGPAAIRFGLNPATIQSQTATSITVAAPATTAGTVDVTISTAGGTSATSAADRYTFK